MSLDNGIVLQIYNACRLLEDFKKGLSFEAFKTDLKSQSAILHQLLVLGEATKRLSQDFKNTHPELPWRSMAGMRDKLIHAYDQIDYLMVWNTLEQNIPELINLLKPLMPRE